MLTRNIDTTAIVTADKFSNKPDLEFSRAYYVNLY